MFLATAFVGCFQIIITNRKINSKITINIFKPSKSPHDNSAFYFLAASPLKPPDNPDLHF